jgi:hypothetical protein
MVFKENDSGGGVRLLGSGTCMAGRTAVVGLVLAST